MPSPVRSALVAGSLLALSSAGLPAHAADVRRLVSVHVSFTGFDARVPAGAVVSVVQRCPAGSSLDRAATRAYAPRGDAEVPSTVETVSRELWPSGMVTRYRVRTAADVPQDDGFGLVGTAFCTGSVPTRATTASGRASTDVRVWGPAPAGARLTSVTLAAVVDRAFGPTGASGADLPYRTALRAQGVPPSDGALRGGVRAAQRVGDDDGSGTVSTTGTTLRSVPRGRFVSMRSTYAYTADLTRRITVSDAPETVVVTARSGGAPGASCTVDPARLTAGPYEVALVAVGGPASVVVRDAGGTVVLERPSVRLAPSADPAGPAVGGSAEPVHGVSEAAVVELAPGDHTVECRPEDGAASTTLLQVTAAPAA